MLDWLAANPVDVLCLQELKQEDHAFPLEALAAAGYRAEFAGQKPITAWRSSTATR